MRCASLSGTLLLMKILVIKLSSLGDLFHALPTVHNLKVGLNAEIHWVTTDAYVDLVKCFADVDRVIPFHRKSFFRNLKPFLADLKSTEYDMVIDLQGLMKSAIVTSFAKAKRKIGPSHHREGAGIFYGEVCGAKNKDRHAVEENLDIIDHLKLERMKPEFLVNVPASTVTEKKPRIAVVPASRWDTKNWPEECFVDVMKRLRKLKDASFFLLGGAGEKNVCGRIAKELGDGVVDMAGKNTLIETCSLLKEMDLVICNDSGPMHMAAAMGVPVLAVFGPTDHARTGPYGDAHRVITAQIDCRPCFSRTCNKPGVPCLEGVTPERVVEAVMEMLG